MAENSIFWATGATGDGLNPYTQAELVDFWLRKFFAMDGYVLEGAGNELAVSGASSPVVVADGAATVYGFPYENTANTNVAIPTPSASTRIDRVILRASWAAQTIRIVRLAGTEGAGAPALTQTPGVTYEVSLAQASITTGGVITLTDERSFAHYSTRVKSAMIDTGAVNAGAIAADAVDDTKAGNRVPQFYRRQGGHGTIWYAIGTSNYTPGAVRMQAGMLQVAASIPAGVGDDITVTFPVAFSEAPLVFATANAPNPAAASTSTTTSTTVILNVYNLHTAAQSINVQWLAIGPE